MDFVATVGVLTWFLEVEDHPDVLLLKLLYDVEFLIEASWWALMSYDIIRDSIRMKTFYGICVFIFPPIFSFTGFTSTEFTDKAALLLDRYTFEATDLVFL